MNETSIPPEENIICRCFVVTEFAIRKAIRDKRLRQVEDITACTHAGGGCQSCWGEIQEILDAAWGRARPAASEQQKEVLGNTQRRAAIAKLVQEDLQALLRLNGLHVELVSVDGDRVLMRFTGAVVGTPQPSFLSIKRYIVRTVSNACRANMSLVEVNVLEKHGTRVRIP